MTWLKQNLLKLFFKNSDRRGVFIAARKMENNGIITSEDGPTKILIDEYKGVGEISSKSSGQGTFNWTKWGAVAGIITVILMIAFYFLPNESENLTKETDSLPFSVYSLFNKTADFSTTATSVQLNDFFKSYEGLNTTADGYVKDVLKNERGQVFALLSKEVNYGFSIICLFDPDQVKTALALPINEKIKFSGIINSFNVGVVLRKCELKQ